MTRSVVDRPVIVCDDAHVYTLDGERVPGVSTVAKVAANPAPLIAWAFRIGREGAPNETPWNTRQRAADRGNAVHDALERLALDGTVPNPDDYPEEERGHVRGLLAWFLATRPEFRACEVMVGSRAHGFAGRYDLEVEYDADRLRQAGVERVDEVGTILALVDLKTSSGVYVEHVVQLEGYEVARREMGYPPSDGRFVLRTDADGGWELVRSWAKAPEVFLPYLHLYQEHEALTYDSPREVERRAKAAAREREKWERAVRDGQVLAALDRLGPSTSRALADDLGREAKDTSASLTRLREDGRVTCSGRTWSLVEVPGLPDEDEGE